MSPNNPHVTNQLRCLIYYHLDNNLTRNALFLAGRLHAYEPRSAESCHLLALCYLRLGELKSAYDHSRGHASKGSHLGCAYVFAEACRLLETHKEKEGISALERSRGLWGTRNNWSERLLSHLPTSPLSNSPIWQTNTPKRVVDIFPMPLRCTACWASYGMLTGS